MIVNLTHRFCFAADLIVDGGRLLKQSGTDARKVLCLRLKRVSLDAEDVPG